MQPGDQSSKYVNDASMSFSKGDHRLSRNSGDGGYGGYNLHKNIHIGCEDGSDAMGDMMANDLNQNIQGVQAVKGDHDDDQA